jgi:hypothetical protein
MIPEVCACSIPSRITSPTRQTHRTPEPWRTPRSSGFRSAPRQLAGLAEDRREAADLAGVVPLDRSERSGGGAACRATPATARPRRSGRRARPATARCTRTAATSPAAPTPPGWPPRPEGARRRPGPTNQYGRRCGARPSPPRPNPQMSSWWRPLPTTGSSASRRTQNATNCNWQSPWIACLSPVRDERVIAPIRA